MGKFHDWIGNKKRELAKEAAFRELAQHRKTLQGIQEEHSYVHTFNYC